MKPKFKTGWRLLSMLLFFGLLLYGQSAVHAAVQGSVTVNFYTVSYKDYYQYEMAKLRSGSDANRLEDLKKIAKPAAKEDVTATDAVLLTKTQPSESYAFAYGDSDHQLKLASLPAGDYAFQLKKAAPDRLMIAQFHDNKETDLSAALDLKVGEKAAVIDIYQLRQESISYHVEHYKQNKDGSFPKSASETEKLTTKNSTVAVTPKKYSGYEYSETAVAGRPISSVDPDGYTVLKAYYNSNALADPKFVPFFPVDDGAHDAYLTGYEDGTLQPNGRITRAEAATIFAKLLAKQNGDTIKEMTYTGFKDSKDDWYTDFVAYIKKEGVMSGYEDGTFRPANRITRAEFATMVANIEKKSTTVASPFVDISGHWAKKSIDAVYLTGKISGEFRNGKRYFRPGDNMSRAESATLLNKLFNRFVTQSTFEYFEPKSFKDVTKEHWAFEQLLEATNAHKYHRHPEKGLGEIWVNTTR